jgi:putative ABC transport system permease protein
MRSGRVPLARRNLLRQRLRLALSVAGVGLALLLVLALSAIYSGILRQVTAYPDKAGAPVMVSQRGVETMHMATSAIPREVTDRIRRDPRVARAEPILYVTATLGDRSPVVVYLIGYRGAGGPWAMAAGRKPPRPGEMIIDQQAANQLGVKVGGRVRALGRELRVVGLASGTASVITSVAFVDIDTFRQAARTQSGASYVLVWPRHGLSASEVARGIQRDYPVTAQTQGQFSTSERHVVSDMSTGLIRGMLVIGFIVGVAVAALSMYTATTSRLRDYAVLKAIGMRNGRLYALVTRQAALTVAGALAAALLLLAAMAFAIPRLNPSMRVVLTGASLVQITLITGAIALIAALLPARRVARIDPASVYRR